MYLERVTVLIYLKTIEKKIIFTWGKRPVETQFKEGFNSHGKLNILYYPIL